jgi:hypothetical protein
LDEPWEWGEGLDQGREVRKSVAITAAATAAFFAAAAPSATTAAAAAFTALSTTTSAPSTATTTASSSAAVASTTTAATTTSEPATTTATAAAFTGRTLFTRARDVDREGPAAEVLTIEHFDGTFGLLGGGELDKRESA